MGADLKITSERAQGKENIIVFHLGGWLDALGEGRLVAAVQKAKDEGAEYVLLELSEMDTITSAGIRAMQKSHQILTPKDDTYKIPHLKLCNAPAQIYQVLGITGFLINVPMYESMEDAIDSFGQ
jgi:anti-anti-sigma regulatory factor